MKKIHLLRHAKSDWADPTLADIDRPLNARGIRTAKFMANQLHEAGCPFINVFCSPAVRAQSTITLISKQLPDLNIRWQTDEALYTFEASHLRQWVQSLDESISELLIVGHNPAFTYFCNELSHGGIANIPTGGYVQLTAKNQFSWPAISEGSFEVSAFLWPKELMSR